MDITPDIPHGLNIINAYSNTGFKISEKDYTGSLVISASKIVPISLSSIELNQEGKILTLIEDFENIEVLLVGTGKTHQRLQNTIKQEIKSKLPHVCVDEMASAAVCRTFNILALEDRKVVAILLLD